MIILKKDCYLHWSFGSGAEGRGLKGLGGLGGLGSSRGKGASGKWWASGG